MPFPAELSAVYFCICLLSAVGSLTCLGRVWVGGLGVDALVVFHILEGKVHQTSSTPMVALGFAIDINEIYEIFQQLLLR